MIRKMSDVRKIDEQKGTRNEPHAEQKKFPWRWRVLIAIGAGVSCFLTIKALTYVPPDVDPPVITLNGEETVEIGLGSDEDYEDAGAIALDERDGELEVAADVPEIDYWNEGEYEVKYSVSDAAGNTAEATRKLKVVAPEPVPGAVYLTFDDGPSEHTSRLLDVLKRYNVKVTFFVTGRGEDEMIKREFEEGHSVGLHSYSHVYSYIYQNTTAYFDDLYEIQNRVKDITGTAPTLIRFPGGSSNTVSRRYDRGTRIMSRLVNEVEEKGFKYFDWNVSSGDAGGATTTEEVIDNVVSKFREGDLIILQHDTAGFSVDAVETIVRYGKKNGYQFKALTSDSFDAHHGVNN